MSIFTTSEQVPKRNLFPLSFNNMLSIQDFGVLYPMLCKRGVPGDVFSHKHAMSMWFFPMSANCMHNFRVKTYYFYVPNRIIYKQWEEFLTQNWLVLSGQVPPYVQLRDLINRKPSTSAPYFCDAMQLADYLNLASFGTNMGNWAQADSTVDDKKSTLPFRAYQKIWRDYFVDEQVTDFVSDCNALDAIFETGSGENVNNFNQLFLLRAKSWKKDRFTTSLNNVVAGSVVPSLASTFTIEDFRQANSLTQFLEKLNRIGTRIQEFTRGVYGVTPKDYRLDMAEFLGASQTDVVKGVVYNNTPSSSGALEDSQGYMVSTARSGDVAGGWRYRVREHGWFMGLVCIEPQPVYFQGHDPKFHAMTPGQYFIPSFENLGDQAVRNDELYAVIPTTTAEDNQNKATFAYSPRYSELKYYDNEVHGWFRTPAGLEYHDARNFSQLYSRDSRSFSQITAINPNVGIPDDRSNLKRCMAVQSGPIAGMNIFHQFRSLRGMQYNATPRITSK